MVYMCIVEIHEMNMTSINKTNEDLQIKQTKTYNLRQNLLRHITKIPDFALTLTKMLSVSN